MNRLTVISAIVCGAVFVAQPCASAGSAAAAASSAASSSKPASAASSSPANATSGQAAPDMSAPMPYTALKYASSQVAANLAKATVCNKFTLVSVSNRAVNQALLSQFKGQVEGLLSSMCRAEQQLGIFDIDAEGKKVTTEECTYPGNRTFVPGIVGAASFATSLSTILGVVQSFVPTYSVTSSSVTIDPSAVPRAVMASLPASAVANPLYGSTDAIQIRDKIGKISSANVAITLHPKPADANLASIQQLAGEAANTFFSTYDANATTQAMAISAIDKTACSLSVDTHAGASSLITKKTFFSSNTVYESGTLVLSYDVSDAKGNFIAAGLVPVACELPSEYKLGAGKPPNLDEVVCNPPSRPSK